MPSESADRPESADPPEDGERFEDDGEPLTEADVERIVRRVVREELDDRDDRSGSVWTVLAGVIAGLFVLIPLSGVVLGTLADVGVPIPLLAIAALLAAAALVAYGWRLPPFR
ncbi:hypothetical protein [Halobaculum roseum]|uniref:Holin-X, holin superfamily III n=1 Tax=Halobaculum roseum TaxID=2175149 RepID=A0ABD5MLG9_9EURY|nr:hypothetical protein [Halobaculum roseum]QZY03960.1 hypothetical protein K6T36_07325 [Halobaculum roseum]